MNGKICLVTGATNGIGKATALALAQMGATVVIVGRNPAKCAAVVSEIKHSRALSHSPCPTELQSEGSPYILVIKQCASHKRWCLGGKPVPLAHI
jgi:NAD(P)-dependent dehydrogenase (short-subunit alcohol dehydrogenase family)